MKKNPKAVVFIYLTRHPDYGMNSKEEGKAWETWMMELETKAGNTRDNYIRFFRQFLRRWNLEPEGLYEMRRSDLNSEDPRDHKRIEKMVKVQMAEMRKAGQAAGTCRNLMKAVKSFFEAQDLDLKFRARDVPRGAYNGQSLAMPDQIREMHDACARAVEFRYRNRALLMFLKDSGLRISDAAKVLVADYLEAITVFNEDEEPFKVWADPLETTKTGAYAYVHIGPEAITALNEYLEERQAEPEAPLFVMEDGRRFTPGALTALFRRMASKLGKRGRKISAHSLRKFHTTMLEATMSKSWICKLQGKSTGPYSQPELLPDQLTGAYIAGYDRLRILALAPAVKAEEVKALRERVKDLEARLERSTRELYLERVEAQRDLAEHQEDISRVKTELKRLFAEVEILKDKPAHATEI